MVGDHMGILGAVVLPGCGPLFGGHLFRGGPVLGRIPNRCRLGTAAEFESGPRLG